jgi:probable F420-dependent oxidoreductase
VFNIGLRHPFTTARGAQTVDLLSQGRFELGIGASWLEEEWVAAQLDFATRGRRVDEAIAVCKRLWTEETVSHHGEFFSFDEVAFEPKPVQPAGPPILVGGESKAALRRAARLADGWIGMSHSFESGAAQIDVLRKFLDESGRSSAPDNFEIALAGPVESRADVTRWEELGVTRMILAPWKRSSDAIDGLRRFADRVGVPRSRDE